MSDGLHAKCIFDRDVALANTGGDHEMLSSIAELLLEEGPRQLHAVKQAVDADDQTAAKDAAHKLKGSVSIFGAEPCMAACVDVESAAAAGNPDRLNSAYNQLAVQLNRLCEAVGRLCD